LLNLQRVAPDDALYATYLKRVTQLRAHPPATSWDGVFDFDTK
jgi:hypothetical protein